MKEIMTMGVDLAKNVFQVLATGAAGEVALRRKPRRSQMLAFFAGLKPCMIGMRLAPERTSGRGSWRRSGTRRG